VHCRHSFQGRCKGTSASQLSSPVEWLSSKLQATIEPCHCTPCQAAETRTRRRLLLRRRGPSPVVGEVDQVRLRRSQRYARWWRSTLSRTSWTSSQSPADGSRACRLALSISPSALYIVNASPVLYAWPLWRVYSGVLSNFSLVFRKDDLSTLPHLLEGHADVSKDWSDKVGSCTC